MGGDACNAFIVGSGTTRSAGNNEKDPRRVTGAGVEGESNEKRTPRACKRSWVRNPVTYALSCIDTVIS
jgi:hypothetical protein